MKNNVTAPEIGFEIIDSKSSTITTAEIAWPQKKVAFLYEECWEDRADCEREGWICFKIEDLTSDDAETILALLKA